MGTLTRALRNISRKKFRALLVIIALGFSMAIMVSIPAGIMANQTAAENVVNNYNTTLTNLETEINKTLTLIECSVSTGFAARSGSSGFGPQAGSGFSNMPQILTRSESYMNESAVSDVSAISSVEAVVPILEKTEGTNETRTTPRGAFQILVPAYTIVGVPLNSSLLNSYSVLPQNIVSGRSLLAGDSGVVLLSTNNTEYFGVEVGSAINILGSYFTVVGVYQPTSSQTATNLYMALSDAQAITGLSGKISVLDVYADDQSSVDSIVSQIQDAYPEFTITTYQTRLSEVQQMQTAYQSTIQNAQAALSQTQAVALQEIGISVAATSLIVLFIMLYTVRERTREIGVFKAIGFSNWNVMSQFMLEGVLLSLIAGVVGVAIGVVGAPVLSSLLLPRTTTAQTGGTQVGENGQTFIPSGVTGSSLQSAVAVTLNPLLILLAFGLAVLLGAVGSLYPAWRASRTSPLEALKYE